MRLEDKALLTLIRGHNKKLEMEDWTIEAVRIEQTFIFEVNNLKAGKYFFNENRI